VFIMAAEVAAEKDLAAESLGQWGPAEMGAEEMVDLFLCKDPQVPMA
jgi:hypothetical protein